MATSYRPYRPDQPLLLPPDLRDWVPERHLVRFLSDTVDALDLSAFRARFAGGGPRCQPYDPRMLVKILLYAYCRGISSSRKIAQSLEDSVAFRFLAADNFPSHRTICRFRQENLALFEGLFLQVLQIAREVGLVKVGTVAIDGSKVKANASRHKAMSYKRMKLEEKRLRKEIRILTGKATAKDLEEDERFGEDFRGDELPEELARRESRLKKIRTARKELEERQRGEDKAAGRRNDAPQEKKGGKDRKRPFGKPEDKKQASFTDPDSRIMRTSSKGWEYSYNAQVAVDDQHQLIVAGKLTQCASDCRELLPMVDAVQENTGEYPIRVLADAGYRSEENFEGLEIREVAGYVALGKEGKKRSPGGASRGPATGKMARRLKSDGGRAWYKKRKWIVEPVFGWIKQCLRFRSFGLRGLKKASAEWSLVCLAVNVSRMNGLMEWGSP